MLRHRPTRLCTAYLLLLLFSAQFLGREMHLVFGHHQHEAVKICAAKPGETHIHDGQYSFGHRCQICLMPHLVAGLLPDGLALPRPSILRHAARCNWTCSVLHAGTVAQPCLRGPPSRA